MSKALQELRRRRAEHGLKRVEVCVTSSDSDLLRRVAKALGRDDDQAERLRTVIDSIVPNKPALTFKEWLASLPDDEGDGDARGQ
jgi:hypothetical protein